NVELAILVLHKAFRARDDHGANGVGTHDMRVVVDLDAARHAVEPKGFGKALEETRLGRGLRQPTAERFTRILHCVIRQILLLATLRDGDKDPTLGLRRECVCKHRLVLDCVRKQNHSRYRLIIVELGDEGAKHFARLQRGISFREVGAVTPVLPGAEEEDLDAVLSAFLMDGENVSFFDRLRVDALVRLYVRERGETIAIDGGAFEIERLGGFLHRGCDLRLYLGGAAGEEVLRLRYKLCIVLGADLAGTRTGAALDLVEKAGAGAAFEDGIRAGADQEGALKRIDGAPDGASGGEG